MDTKALQDLKKIYKTFEASVEAENWSKAFTLGNMARHVMLKASINIDIFNAIGKKPPLKTGENEKLVND